MSNIIPKPNLDLDLNLEVLLSILLDTAQTYMEAFELDEESINLSISILKKYQAFKKITIYYFDAKNECVSFASFNFDWEQYKLNCTCDDPDIIINRKTIVSQTPKQILEEASTIIKKNVSDMKKERGVTRTRIVYTYSDALAIDNTLREKIREEGGFIPFTDNIIYSKKLDGIAVQVVSSLTENTLSINYVL